MASGLVGCGVVWQCGNVCQLEPAPAGNTLPSGTSLRGSDLAEHFVCHNNSLDNKSRLVAKHPNMFQPKIHITKMYKLYTDPEIYHMKELVLVAKSVIL